MFDPIKEYGITFGFESVYPNTWFFKVRGLAGKQHNAWDYAAPSGRPIHAPERMQIHEVVNSGWRQYVGYGKMVRAISLEDKVTEFYFAHLSVMAWPRVGKIVQADQIFAWSGNTGWSSGSHLHFAVKREGLWINPATLYA